jgi:hypothetical protein
VSRNGARPKRRGGDFTRSSHSAEMRAHKLHEDLKDFEEFQNETLKVLRQDIKKGLKAKDLREKYIALLQGKVLTQALTTEDASQALAILKDLADRVEGKAKETKEVQHRMEKLSDKELDALLKSEEEELERMHQQFRSDN